MTVPTASFKWLDILEKEFDKSAVGLRLLFHAPVFLTSNFPWPSSLKWHHDFANYDLALLGDFSTENDFDSMFDETDLATEGQEKLAVLISCFSQLTHKAQTIFQTNAKYEAEMLHIREDLAEAIAARKSAEQQLSDLLVQTHAAQLQMHSKSGSAAVLTDAEAILKRLTNELEGKRLEMSNEFKLDSKLKLYKEENENLRAYVTALHAEIFGARLAAKYLDKELAGRIQQMQLLGREVCPDLREKLWNEIESEIQVQRQKVMVKACQAQGRNRRHFASQLSLHRHASENETSRSSSVERISQIVEDVDNGVNTNQLLTEVADSNGNEDKKLRRRVAPVRTVTITRQETEGLGMSITGGAEHGVPILVSELYPDTPAGRCSSLHIGDSIVSVNGIDLRKVLHAEAVKILCTQPAGHTYLEVQYINPSDDLSDDDDILPENFKYGFFHGEESNSEPPNFKDSGDKTPTAPRTPEPSINDIVSENVPDY